MSPPPTVLGPPNTVVQIQPGMLVQVACIVPPQPGSAVLTAAGEPNVSVLIQPGMQVPAICLVDSSGHFVS